MATVATQKLTGILNWQAVAGFIGFTGSEVLSEQRNDMQYPANWLKTQDKKVVVGFCINFPSEKISRK